MSHTSSLADRTRRKGVQIRRAAAKRAAFVQRIHPDTCYVTIDGELVMASHHPKLDMQCDSFWRAQRGQQRATRQDERGQLAYEAGMQDLEGEGEDPLDELYETGADEIDDPYGSMADWERELLVEAVLPPIEYTVGHTSRPTPTMRGSTGTMKCSSATTTATVSSGASITSIQVTAWMPCSARLTSAATAASA